MWSTHCYVLSGPQNSPGLLLFIEDTQQYLYGEARSPLMHFAFGLLKSCWPAWTVPGGFGSSQVDLSMTKQLQMWTALNQHGCGTVCARQLSCQGYHSSPLVSYSSVAGIVSRSHRRSVTHMIPSKQMKAGLNFALCSLKSRPLFQCSLWGSYQENKDRTLFKILMNLCIFYLNL